MATIVREPLAIYGKTSFSAQEYLEMESAAEKKHEFFTFNSSFINFANLADIS